MTELELKISTTVPPERRRGAFLLFQTCLIAVLFTSCQCVELPEALRCTPASCGAGEVCGGDGRCSVADAGCTPRASCETDARECGLLDTGCGEVFCGECATGLTCGSLQPGRCAPCDLNAFDVPDPDFADTNCDGIDGTVDGGLFVDPQSGSDLAPGTRTRPLYSLARAAELVQLAPTSHTIFIAQGVTEGLTWRAPVSLAGGYRTPGWIRNRSVTTIVRSRGTGLRLESLPASVSVSQLSIESTPGDPGTASIGLLVFESPVTLQQLSVRSADGPPGMPGRDGAIGATGGDGAPGSIGTSGQLCLGCDRPVPGPGGDGGVGLCGQGQPGVAPNIPTARRQSGPLDRLLTKPEVEPCSDCPCSDMLTGTTEVVAGLDESPASAVDAGGTGAAGQSGPVSAGSLDGGVWIASFGAAGGAGLQGAPGAPGSFGGSAAYQIALADGGLELHSAALGSSGGGGGAPGCGGSPGEGGQQGGASIGLVIVGAAPRLEAVGVVAGQGGAGGPSGTGGPGGPGGAGAAGGPRWTADCDLPSLIVIFALNPPSAPPTGLNSYFTGGAGGRGGSGGPGGMGGTGAVGPGGPSVGVWCERSAVLLTEVRVLVSAGGAGSVAGVSQTTLNCQ